MEQENKTPTTSYHKADAILWLQNSKTALDPEFTETEPLQAVRLYKPQPTYTPATTVQENDFTIVTYIVQNWHVISFLPSFPSALQLRVSFGLLNNQPPFFSILHLSSPTFHFHFTEIIIYILQPFPTWEIQVWREEYYQH
jgi:hypothetical protein